MENEEEETPSEFNNDDTAENEKEVVVDNVVADKTNS